MAGGDADRRIRILPPETARLIAAGEVIDRPASALRELLDNAIDSGASQVAVRIEGGGIALISVGDDGSGMSADDLALSVKPHATSKIESADDLLTARTLGFRGEALASIAATARLEILTRRPEDRAGGRLVCGPGVESSLQPAAAPTGTTVTVTALFERYPARRQFLKRPQSEAALCRQVFAERAAAHPAIAFRWQSGAQAESLPADDPARRILALYPELRAGILQTARFEGQGFSGSLVYASPAFARRDRRQVQVFVNRRRVPEWGLASVLEYAYAPWLPGGAHPCVFLFAEVDPADADFNIHPAKREVRLKRPEVLKSAVLAALREALSASTPTPGAAYEMPYQAGLDLGATAAPREDRYLAAQPEPAYRAGPAEAQALSSLALSSLAFSSLASSSPAFQNPGRSGPAPSTLPPLDSFRGLDPLPAAAPGHGFRYLGQAFGPFLVFEMDESLYILDQHAAHERILYDDLKSRGATGQSLLVPLALDELGPDARDGFDAARADLERAGYRFEASGDGWLVQEVPALLGEKAISALAEALHEGFGEPGDHVLATIACKAAVKDGDSLDPAAAIDLIARALRLLQPRCPHGRPVWVRFDRDRLYRMVGRIPVPAGTASPANPDLSGAES